MEIPPPFVLPRRSSLCHSLIPERQSIDKLTPTFSEATLEEAQPVEQAGFRRSFSTIDHIHSIERLLEVGCEYQQPITLVFIAFDKAFDSVVPQAIWKSL
uniref:Reverse transcriptase domain-containing protein n=1 Tax=Caenorhabditis japonica TaxID=281687 RepID=A0A8R1I3M2_CAEJA